MALGQGSQTSTKSALQPTPPSKPSADEIKGIIRYWASYYGVDENLMQDLALWESQYRPEAKNKSSTATGLFQFLDGTWKLCEGNRLDPNDNAKCAAKMISEPNGIRHWSIDPTIQKKLVDAGYAHCPNPEKNLCFREEINGDK